MDKVLVYKNRKSDPIYWDASDAAKTDAAFLKLFKHLRDEWGIYDETPPTGKEKKLFQKAQDGDGAAARKLLEGRKDNDYENWTLAEVKDPFEPDADDEDEEEDDEDEEDDGNGEHGDGDDPDELE